MKPKIIKLFLYTSLLFLQPLSPASAGIVDYTYDKAGRLTESNYDSGKLIQYTYDNAGNLAQKSISDTAPPSAPIVGGATPTNDTTPPWNWVSGGGGNGTFRYKLNDSNLAAGATTTTTTSYTPATALSAGTHNLHVQERNAAGAWSTAGSFAVTIDTAMANAPTLNGSNTPSGTSGNNKCYTWIWNSSGGNSTFRYKLDDPDLPTAATVTTKTSYTACGLSPGNHTLYIQEQYSAKTAGKISWSSAIAVTITVAAATVIPTLSQWALLFLTILLIFSAVIILTGKRGRRIFPLGSLEHVERRRT